MTRTRVAVLGGGPGAITAAFELTATPELREAYEVTVHTLGWRLGGKGASGRNAAKAQRIEEHGLHIWFGFYDNAFGAMRRCYEELGRPRDAPLAKWSDAFKPRDDCVQYEFFREEWVPHHFTLPRNPLVPGDPPDVHLWEMLRSAFAFIENSWRSLESPGPVSARERIARARVRGGLRLLHRRARHRASRDRHAPFELRVAAWLTSRVRNWVWRHVVRARLEHKGLRLFYMWLDLAAAMLAGIANDRLIENGFGSINGEEFRAWLSRHGASPMTVEGSPMVRAIYDAAFCYEDGDVAKPNVAAGKAAQDLIRSIFMYKGALMYKMQAGMGDTVFGPFYEVLRRRGVRFEFFHCVTRLGTGPEGDSVEEIDFVPQATVTREDYEPLIDVKGLPCWPSEPDWTQLEEGDQLAAQGVNLEQDINPLGHGPVTLRRGVDFDVAVLAIPVGALPAICGELAAANERFAQMLDHSHVVMTQALQLWLTRDTRELGFGYEVGSLASCFAEPLDTYCDMNQLLVREEWPPAK
ncbi:MAG TPA: NAD(P)-binding protein, partial [Solirubrobacteraceae bacterium]|nr:NAD(P)-binding protein [Solirubrobacteraceae bacterium]